MSDAATSRLVEHHLRIPVGKVELDGDLVLPDRARGMVLFAHGSGSSRLSPRNQYVAGWLNERGLGTLLLDLLTRQEEQTDIRTAHLRFDIGLLAGRLIQATEWLKQDLRTTHLFLGYFGASTGAAAALVAAAQCGPDIKAIVSRGGRPDMAQAALLRIKAPTLLIVGGADQSVLELNREALALIPQATVKRLEIVPGATHLFEEEGALERVAGLAGNWFSTYLDINSQSSD